jgi:hypothetical protein
VEYEDLDCADSTCICGNQTPRKSEEGDDIHRKKRNSCHDKEEKNI